MKVGHFVNVQRWTVVKYFYFTQVHLKSICTLSECFSLENFYLPKHNVLIFTAVHFINKSCWFFTFNLKCSTFLTCTTPE